jgi:hypothetical protein
VVSRLEEMALIGTMRFAHSFAHGSIDNTRLTTEH